MSYDLMVFEEAVAPKESREVFIAWYREQAKWAEGHSYQDHNVTSESLQNWFKEMIQYFPAMNGPLASKCEDNEKVTDHCIGKNVIYSCFSWSVVEEAHSKMRELAIKHSVGFFDVSAGNGEIIFPGLSFEIPPNPIPSVQQAPKKRAWWKLW